MYIDISGGNVNKSGAGDDIFSKKVLGEVRKIGINVEISTQKQLQKILEKVTKKY